MLPLLVSGFLEGWWLDNGCQKQREVDKFLKSLLSIGIYLSLTEKVQKGGEETVLGKNKVAFDFPIFLFSPNFRSHINMTSFPFQDGSVRFGDNTLCIASWLVMGLTLTFQKDPTHLALLRRADCFLDQ